MSVSEMSHSKSSTLVGSQMLESMQAPPLLTIDPTPPTYIPASHVNRTVILCFDGTGNQFDQNNSNIVQLVSLLKKDDRFKQIIYYQPGIGTYASPSIATPLGTQLTETVDSMIAWNINAHVMSGYEFLMQNYDMGDRICIFGFSRGAYTARALAGMIHKVGLLPRDNFQQVPFAYKMYTMSDELGWKQSNAFKRAFSNDVEIEFVGVWDTVCSVGVIPRRLPFTASNTVIRTFRHAISLDERRAKFKANLWGQQNPNAVDLGFHTPPVGKASGPNVLPLPKTVPSSPTPSSPTPSSPTADSSFIDSIYHRSRSYSPPKKTLTEFEKDFELQSAKEHVQRHARTTDVLEVWFAGCHGDVGGGSVLNDTPYTLARIPLRWMVRECFKANTGIMFDSEKLREVGLEPATLYPTVLQRPKALPVPKDMRVQIVSSVEQQAGKKVPDSMETLEVSLVTEEEHELWDAMQPIYDRLSLVKPWWALEVLPFKHLDVEKKREVRRWNLGRPRVIPDMTEGVKIHRSVKLRMEAGQNEKVGGGYLPRPKKLLELATIEWVD